MLSLPRTHRQPLFVCFSAVFTVVVCAGIAAAAMLVPAPTPDVPLIAIVCVLCPLFAAWELPGALARLGVGRERALARMRRGLARLPETEHPLGL